MEERLGVVSEAHRRGIVFDIQRYSLHDGPGLRTNVFLKGCSLACEWCSNPESRDSRPEIAFFHSNCFLCGDCIPACPRGAIAMREGELVWLREACDSCGDCVQVCSSGAFRLIGEEKSTADVMQQVLRDAAFYGEGGGLTLTGGEPALQPDFSAAILKLAKAEGLHTAIETCGNVPWIYYEKLLPYLDLALFDIKHADPVNHRQGTRVDNHLILENARRMSQEKVEMIVRVPLIPGFNTDEDSLIQLGAFVASLQTVREVHLLPYHSLARSKYKALGQDYPLGDVPPMRREEAEPLAEIFQKLGFSTLIGG